ncbi:MAG: CCA tRNA nucleotidyltransferase, partial [Anaerolineae bacterium]
VTARTEFYAQPTALPEVASSSIKQDLHRRDFTINTLAIRLDPDHWGELLDFYGGEADLQSGVVRVLHSLSFVDDPTRVLRAARFESRLGFEIDPRTLQLIADALPLLKRVSGSRIRNELGLIFEETEPERALCRLDELGALEQISPGLQCDGWLREKIRILHRELDAGVWGLAPDDMFFLHMALLTVRLEPDEFESLVAYLQLKRDDLDDLRLVRGLEPVLDQVREAAKPSGIARLLEPYPTRVLAAGWTIADDAQLRQRLLRYQTEWRLVEPEITGDDLKALGLRPGPVFGELLDALRDARLDSVVTNGAGEQALLQELMGARGIVAALREDER